MDAKKQTLRTPIEILLAAEKKERDAYHFYDALLQNTRVLLVRDLLEQLRDEERKHLRLIEKKLTEIKSGR